MSSAASWPELVVKGGPRALFSTHGRYRASYASNWSSSIVCGDEQVCMAQTHARMPCFGTKTKSCENGSILYY